MFKSSKIKQNSIFGPVKAQKFFAVSELSKMVPANGLALLQGYLWHSDDFFCGEKY